MTLALRRLLFAAAILPLPFASSAQDWQAKEVVKTGGQRPLSCFPLALLAQKTAQRSERRNERAGRLPVAKWQRCVVHWY